VPHRVLQSSKNPGLCIPLLTRPNYALDGSNAARIRGPEIAKVNKTHKFMEGKMKKILFIFLILVFYVLPMALLLPSAANRFTGESGRVSQYGTDQ